MATIENSGGQSAEGAANNSALGAGGLLFSARERREPANVVVDTRTAHSSTMVLFQEPDISRAVVARRARRSAEVENTDSEAASEQSTTGAKEESGESPRRSRRGSRGGRRVADSHEGALEDAESVEPQGEEQDLSSEGAQPQPRARRRTRAARAESAHGEGGASHESRDDSGQSTAELGEQPELKEDSGKSAKKAKKTNGKASAPSSDAVAAAVTVRKRRRRAVSDDVSDQVTAPKGSTRLEAKRQRRKEGREAGRRRHTITESEFLARRESVNREMLIRERDGLNQIAVIEDGVLVEHYVARHTQSSMVGNVYLGRVQNVLPSMEAAFVDIGKGRNAVLYAGEVNWDVAGLEGKPRRIEEALKSGDTVLVQVTKDPIGHKGARLTSQITLAGRHLVLVPSGAMTGISRKLPEKERTRLKRILRDLVPAEHGVIVRTAAEGATEEQLRSDVERLTKTWKDIEAKSKSSKNAPSLLKGEPELAVRVVRDVFNEDFTTLKVQGETTWQTISEYVQEFSPELMERVHRWDSDQDIFYANRVDEQLAKAFDRKVFLPSGGTLVIDRTEAMTVIDVNTGKFTGSGGTLEETVTKNNLEAAEEIVRQLRLRDIGGIVVIDFIDMVLEANRDLVLRRLIECLGRDRTRHQVAEVTSLGLVQMTRKRVGQGLVEAFSTVCEACEGRGYITYDHPIEKGETPDVESMVVGGAAPARVEYPEKESDPEAEAKQAEVKAALNNIAAAAAHKHRVQESASAAHEAHEPAEVAEPAEKPAQESAAAPQATVLQRARSQRGRKGAKASSDSNPAALDSPESGVMPAAGMPSTAPAQAPAAAESAKKPPRIVRSSGTITPAGSGNAHGAIMSFPIKK
ncbi:MAG: Rne/Rng family ribonuclease [Arcanobacterium sp.]|nr:Rne/Rng family ribonuclease [Arcanobacterium sp.]